MPTRTVSPNAVADLAHSWVSSDDGRELFDELSAQLRKIVPFDGSAWFGTDPATVLATHPVRIENVEPGHCESYWSREYSEEDVLLFRDLARAESPADSLFHATDDRPARSVRYREFLQPQGYSDEVRAAFRVGASTWGVVDLFRDASARPFSEDDVAVIRSLTPAIATALRSFATYTRSSAGGADADGPGTALYHADGTLVSLDDQAERWFAELAGAHWRHRESPLMATVSAVVARADAVAVGRERGASMARLRAEGGRWLTVHASSLRSTDDLPGLTVVVIEPAKSAQIAPIIVEAYSLTPREREITQALARGLTNNEIAGQLHLSAHTVRDHLKAIFSKVGVGSRGELVAKIFADHYGPALHAIPFAQVHTEV
ncbi:LuxR C-terminal-related transcriptional regulator [Microbacterium sp. BWT-B31]|uniref:LuxR C-terminal-related transcriptional regulator n=1 Tax=Microbacterium sp. BWT-B31 TaxID=3232072 RepID=UPI003528208D